MFPPVAPRCGGGSAGRREFLNPPQGSDLAQGAASPTSSTATTPAPAPPFGPGFVPLRTPDAGHESGGRLQPRPQTRAPPLRMKLRDRRVRVEEPTRGRLPLKFATALPAMAMAQPPPADSAAVPPETDEFRRLVTGYLHSLGDEGAVERLSALRALCDESEEAAASAAPPPRKPSLPPSVSPSSHLSLVLPPTSPYASRRQYAKAQVRLDYAERCVVDLREPARPLLLPSMEDEAKRAARVDRSTEAEEERLWGTQAVPFPQSPFCTTRSPANPSRHDIYLEQEAQDPARMLRQRRTDAANSGGSGGDESVQKLRSQQGAELERAIVDACQMAQLRGEWSRRARQQLVDHVAEGRPKLPTQEQLQRASHRRHTKERQRERRMARQTLRNAKREQRRREQAEMHKAGGDIKVREANRSPRHADVAHMWRSAR